MSRADDLPFVIRMMWICTWSFGSRRQVIRVWVLWDTNRALCAVRNVLFWIRNPGLWIRVRRLASAWAKGQDIIEV
jgi:hypothetical protein